MNETMELNDINENDDQDRIRRDEDKEYFFRCKWCGTEWPKSELVIVDGVKLCKVCNEIISEEK